jgi:methionine aminopeptidase
MYVTLLSISLSQKTSAIFKNKNKAGKVILKGVAFPVCISVNEIICHCSPLESDDSVRSDTTHLVISYEF